MFQIFVMHSFHTPVYTYLACKKFVDTHWRNEKSKRRKKKTRKIGIVLFTKYQWVSKIMCVL